jgi:hypothetical protein
LLLEEGDKVMRELARIFGIMMVAAVLAIPVYAMAGGGGGMGGGGMGAGAGGGMGAGGVGGMGAGGMGAGGGIGAGPGGAMGESMSASGAGPMGGQQMGPQSNGQMARGGSAPAAIMPVMQQTSEIMYQMSKEMTPEMSHESRIGMAQTMEEMSTQMLDIAQMMEKGNISDKDMQVVQQRIADMKSRLERIQAK